MIDLQAAGRQISDMMDRLPLNPGMLANRLERYIPSVQLYSRNDMADAYSATVHQVVDETWDRFEQRLTSLAPSRTTRLSSRVVLIPTMVAFIAALGCTLGASFGAGCNACMEAARLYRSGHPESAIARLRQNSVEVYYTLRTIENIILISLTGVCFLASYLLLGFTIRHYKQLASS